jgi:hypothetical protein
LGRVRARIFLPFIGGEGIGNTQFPMFHSGDNQGRGGRLTIAWLSVDGKMTGTLHRTRRLRAASRIILGRQHHRESHETRTEVANGRLNGNSMSNDKVKLGSRWCSAWKRRQRQSFLLPPA